MLYNHHYYVLKEELKEVYRLSITLDFWSNRKAESFLCMTGHWTTNSFDSVCKIIDFSSFNTRHAAIEIAKVLKEKLIALNIYEKLVCITTDGAPHIVLACELLNDEIFRFWCRAHRLYLVVINAFGFWLPKKKLNSELNNDLTTNVSMISTCITTTDDIQKKDEEMDINWDEELSEGKSFCSAHIRMLASSPRLLSILDLPRRIQNWACSQF